MEQKKLLLVATRQFWPVTSGKTCTLYHFCRGLHEQYGYEIHAICFADALTDKSLKKPDFLDEVEYIDVPKVLGSFGNLLFRSLLGKWPIQCSLYYRKSIEKQIADRCSIIKPDAVFIDMVRLSPYVKALNGISAKKILIEDDLLAKRYRRQLKSFRSENGGVSGAFSQNMPGFLEKLSRFPWIQSRILQYEANKLDRFESRNVALFDYITFISPIEAKEFNKGNSTDKAITLTMGADVQYYSQDIPANPIPNSISVVGNFQTTANAATMEWICKDILPRFPEQIEYYVIGSFPKDLRDHIDCRKLKILGFTDDLRAAVKSTEVYFAPILFGTGIKTKIVEAMAMGMPVVTNSVGAEGLNVQNGRELFISDDPQELADITLRLLNDPELREEIGMCGQRYVRTYHDWNEIYKSFELMGFEHARAFKDPN